MAHFQAPKLISAKPLDTSRLLLRSVNEPGKKFEIDVVRIEIVLERVVAIAGDPTRERLEAVGLAVAVEIDLQLHLDAIRRETIGERDLAREAEPLLGAGRAG
jgi:hypothetical protein